MVDLEADYSREQAVEDGVIVNVSDLGSAAGIAFSVGVSNALLRHPEIDRDWGNVGSLLLMAAEDIDRSAAGGPTECTFSAIIDKREYAAIVEVTVVVEPSGEGHVATLIEARECYDLRCPRRGSFYPF